MQVIRIENEYGQGPYVAGGAKMFRNEHSDRKHPTWKEETGYIPQDWANRWHIPSADVLHGFKDMDQLNKWFTPLELKKMERNGFEVKVFEAKFVTHARKQVLFVKLEA